MLLEGQLDDEAAEEFTLSELSEEESPLEAEDSPDEDDPPPLQEITRRLK